MTCLQHSAFTFKQAFSHTWSVNNKTTARLSTFCKGPLSPVRLGRVCLTPSPSDLPAAQQSLQATSAESPPASPPVRNTGQSTGKPTVGTTTNKTNKQNPQIPVICWCNQIFAKKEKRKSTLKLYLVFPFPWPKVKDAWLRLPL